MSQLIHSIRRTLGWCPHAHFLEIACCLLTRLLLNAVVHLTNISFELITALVEASSTSCQALHPRLTMSFLTLMLFTIVYNCSDLFLRYHLVASINFRRLLLIDPQRLGVFAKSNLWHQLLLLLNLLLCSRLNIDMERIGREVSWFDCKIAIFGLIRYVICRSICCLSTAVTVIALIFEFWSATGARLHDFCDILPTRN